MRIAIYTLTRDRLDYTKHCFMRLKEKAGCAFDHFVVDNGSEDGSAEWLEEEYKPFSLIKHPKNFGISHGSNVALAAIADASKVWPYDFICKIDNDCELTQPNTLLKVAQFTHYLIHKMLRQSVLVSPRVNGINRQPYRGGSFATPLGEFGMTAIVGGLFHCAPARMYLRYRFPMDIPLAKGQDDAFCHWIKAACQGVVGYYENITVNHYRTTDQQAEDYPEYFKRKWEEEKIKGNGN